jgi:hypothetical protein
MSRILQRVHRDDRGLSMAELLVYCLLLGGVLGLVGTLLINSLRTNETVTTVVDASTQAQLAAQSLERGIRNASTFQLTIVGSSDQVLLARVASNTSAWVCEAWYYSNAEGTIRHMKSDTKIFSTAWTNDLATWTLLAEGVEPVEGSAPTAPILSANGPILSLDFIVKAGDDPPATISSSAVSRLSQGSSQCF